jgi:hypothetical protein
MNGSAVGADLPSCVSRRRIVLTGALDFVYISRSDFAQQKIEENFDVP